MIGDAFTFVLLDPMMNLLVIFANVLFDSFGLAIIAFTIFVRLLTFPLTLRQLHQTRAMQEVQPRIQELSKKYSDPRRRQEEIMKIYRESGVNPLGCLGPMLLQMPILIALFIAVRETLPASPEALIRLNSHLYGWSYIQDAVPLGPTFLIFDLRHPDTIMVVLVALTTWGQSKTTITVTTDERARAQQQMMTWMMPLMFGFFALSVPAGVSLYWVVNSVVGIAMNVVIYGFPRFKIKPLVKSRQRAAAAVTTAAAPSGSPSVPPRSDAARELRTANGSGRSKRQNRRRRS